jgi:hypothetical protein
MRDLHPQVHGRGAGAGIQLARRPAEAGEAYITSQKAEGWVCLPERYDDGGYTGGNMDRPALHRLLADIEAGRIDASRSTRSIASAGHSWTSPG